MERRKAARAAGIVTVIAAAAGVAIGANVGILRREPAEPVGVLTPVSTDTSTTAPPVEVVTVYADDPPTATTSPPPALSQPIEASRNAWDDEDDEGGESRHDDDHGDDHEDDGRERDD